MLIPRVRDTGERYGGHSSCGWSDVVRTRTLLHYITTKAQRVWFSCPIDLVSNMTLPLGHRSFFTIRYLGVVEFRYFRVSPSLCFVEFTRVPVIFLGLCYAALSLVCLRAKKGCCRFWVLCLGPRTISHLVAWVTTCKKHLWIPMGACLVTLDEEYIVFDNYYPTKFRSRIPFPIHDTWVVELNGPQWSSLFGGALRERGHA